MGWQMQARASPRVVASTALVTEGACPPLRLQH
jgi:hypothetical protein